MLFFLADFCFHQANSKEQASSATRSFTIDFDNNTFLKDGKPFFYVSGGMHYFRVPSYYWKDRLQKLVAAGMDAVQTYVAWNLHEPMPGVYDFNGQQDLPAFLTAAQDAGLLVILRVGPYICAEWEYGGLPAWLLSDNETMTVRTVDKKYLAAVDRWLGVFLPMMKPYLYSNGGPIILVQVENEYGSYRAVACSHDYMAHLRDVFKLHLGNDALLFSTDGNSVDLLKCGAIDGVYAIVDFGPDQDAKQAFAPMRQWNPKGPLVNGECYTGWLDYWGGGHAHGSTATLINGLQAIHNLNASVNMYMFEGGTSFGYMNGADPTFSICPTSYDYDAPLTEAGDITDKYLAIRKFMSQYKMLPKIPDNTPKYAYGPVVLHKVGSVLNMLNVLGSKSPLRTVYPLNMEQANHFYGFVLYRHVLKQTYSSAEFKATGIRDRGYVLFDGIPRGLLDRNSATSFNAFGYPGQTVDIIVENQGRINYGPAINDNKKGLISNVTFGGNILTNWDMYPLHLEKVFSFLEERKLTFRNEKFMQEAKQRQMPYEPTVYKGEFVLQSDKPQDTFLNMCGWFKGQAFINGFNVGRYWPIRGPQVTLFVPAGVLYASPTPNVIVMVELEHAPSTGSAGTVDYVEFVKEPIINGHCFNGSYVERVPPSTVKSSGRRPAF